jgi:predicted HTH domain antitoxin
MADIAVALHRSNGLLSIAKMSQLSGVARTEIYKILRRCDGKDDAPSR